MQAILRSLIIAFAVIVSCSPAIASDEEVQPEESLRIFAVRVIKTPPLKAQFVGFGIYLGDGAVLSAAHVVGRWPWFTNPRVLVGGRDLPATVLKMGSSDDLDVTLLRIDQSQLPIIMRMRRNPLCRTAPVPGEPVFAVDPDKVVATRILSPFFVAPGLRANYGTLVESVVTASGSGVFRASTKCLLGIMSKSIPMADLVVPHDDEKSGTRKHAGYFVPASQIAAFLPPEFRF